MNLSSTYISYAFRLAGVGRQRETERKKSIMHNGYFLMISYLMSCVRILGLLVAGHYGAFFIKRKLEAYLVSTYPQELRAGLIARILAAFYLFIIFTAVAHELGLHLTAFLGAAGVVGIALAYACQTTLSTIISGLFLAVESPFKVHDILVIDGVEATVETINLLAVTLRTQVGTVMRVPHEQLLKKPFINVSRLPRRRYDTAIAVDVTENVDRVIPLLYELVETNGWASKEYTTIFLQEIAGNYLKISVRIWVDTAHFSTIQKVVPGEIKKMIDLYSIKMAVLPVVVFNDNK